MSDYDSNDEHDGVGDGVTRLAVYQTKKAPRLKEIAVESLIKFKREYARYKKDLLTANPNRVWAEVIHLRKVDCIEEELLRTICEFGWLREAEAQDDGLEDDLGDEEVPPQVDTITDAQIDEFIEREIRLPFTTMTGVEKLTDLASRSLVYDLSKPVRGRVFDLFSQFNELLVQHNLEVRLTGKNEKMVGKMLISVLRPVGLKENIMTYIDEVLGGTAYRDKQTMFKIIMEKATAYEMVHTSLRGSARRDEPIVVQRQRPAAAGRSNRGAGRGGRTNQRTERSRGSGARGDRGHSSGASVNGGGGSSAAAFVSSSRRSSSGSGAGASSSTRRAGVPDNGCLHCQGTHWLRDCPTASAADKDAIFERMKSAGRSSRSGGGHRARHTGGVGA